MTFTTRAYVEEVDREAVLALRRVCTTPENVVDYPSLTDLHEFLNPVRREQHTHIRLWEDSKGRLLAYANVALPSSSFSFLIHPMAWETSIPAEIIAYATAVRAASGADGEERELGTNCRDSDEQRLCYLLQAGFELEEGEVPVMVRTLADEIPEPEPPVGYKLRHIVGEEEVEACVALHRAAFGTQNMTVEQRLSIMREPDYDPRGDLVIEAPDGALVSYCICLVHPEENAQSGRNWGYTDPIGVHPDYQRRGLGKAVLLGGLRYLKARDVDTASFMTSSDNAAMLGLGTAAGFHRFYAYHWLSKRG
ncbi:GNAT family N-acetyltransferase [Ktedonobacter racemifer]|uniref:GCN5-related N-acetyltransferase n=1 Tax=Ktedonobacter racemifer DSM 44963 TaxID=485913 RepID=D6TTG3_KTERA|nr:GNAT family N-acetyltransferase [Ktedonobacter racemifer]EFH83714.1 GCN5-related N-acetyltransferase [Ktedonobacter racemifer DSM 44963]